MSLARFWQTWWAQLHCDPWSWCIKKHCFGFLGIHVKNQDGTTSLVSHISEFLQHPPTSSNGVTRDVCTEKPRRIGQARVELLLRQQAFKPKCDIHGREGEVEAWETIWLEVATTLLVLKWVVHPHPQKLEWLIWRSPLRRTARARGRRLLGAWAFLFLKVKVTLHHRDLLDWRVDLILERWEKWGLAVEGHNWVWYSADWIGFTFRFNTSIHQSLIYRQIFF